MFKHPKMRNVTQTLLKKIFHLCVVFFGVHSFQCLNTENCCLSVSGIVMVQFHLDELYLHSLHYVQYFSVVDSFSSGQPQKIGTKAYLLGCCL